MSECGQGETKKGFYVSSDGGSISYHNVAILSFWDFSENARESLGQGC